MACRQRNVYRGQVLTLAGDHFELKVGRLERVTREQIDLPERLLTRIERPTMPFTRTPSDAERPAASSS